VVDLQVAVDEHLRPRPQHSLSESAISRDHVGGKNVVGDEPLALVGEPRREVVDAAPGPWRQRRVVQRPGRGARRGPRRRRCSRRLTEMTEYPPRKRGQRERGRSPPEDLRRRNRRYRHCLNLDVEASLISVDLHEHVADAQSRALVMGNDDLHLLNRSDPGTLHPGHHRGRTFDVVGWNGHTPR
jgi:hypothetical protein